MLIIHPNPKHAPRHMNPPVSAAELSALLERQRAAYAARPMRTAAERRDALAALADALYRRKDDFIAAINQDFGQRASHETQLMEWLPVLDEIAAIRRQLPRWMRSERVAANWNFLPSRARILPQPLGVVGIIGAWNYPLLLTLSPLANALGAGNHALIKPSERAPASARLIAELVADTFPADYVSVVNGDADVSAAFAALPFDHLVFTGSTATGRKVMQAAAANLTPVTLELGGKSPALVHESFDITQAAQRIASAKFWNAGQTCIAPDYVLVPAAKLDGFVSAVQASVAQHWPDPAHNRDYTRMIDAAAWQRMHALLDDARTRGARPIELSGPADIAGQGGAFMPTVLLDVSADMQVMQEEIFGPILPIIPYQTLDEALHHIRQGERPLAMYYFDNDRQRIRHVLAHSHAGGVTINDCLFHQVQHRLPFGGIGASGIGAYHGIDGFRRFSHRKPILLQSGLTARLLGKLIKPPYGPMTDRLIRFITRR